MLSTVESIQSIYDRYRVDIPELPKENIIK